ncbi:hypothetical protein F-VV10_0228 [Faustovirus]|nr:hypothetical protein F-VV10_0228 [Faustovirus]
MLIIEALVVGVVLSVLMMVVYAIVPIVGILSAGIVGFIAGLSAHLVFEFIGANSWYCDNGNACKV